MGHARIVVQLFDCIAQKKKKHQVALRAEGGGRLRRAIQILTADR